MLRPEKRVQNSARLRQMTTLFGHAPKHDRFQTATACHASRLATIDQHSHQKANQPQKRTRQQTNHNQYYNSLLRASKRVQKSARPLALSLVRAVKASQVQPHKPRPAATGQHSDQEMRARRFLEIAIRADQPLVVECQSSTQTPNRGSCFRQNPALLISGHVHICLTHSPQGSQALSLRDPRRPTSFVTRSE